MVWFLGVDGDPDLSRRIIQLVYEKLLKRHFIGRKAVSKRASLNPQLADALRLFADQHRLMAYDDIGLLFNADGGRVSEALKGWDWSPGTQLKLEKRGMWVRRQPIIP